MYDICLILHIYEINFKWTIRLINLFDDEERELLIFHCSHEMLIVFI